MNDVDQVRALDLLSNTVPKEGREKNGMLPQFIYLLISKSHSLNDNEVYYLLLTQFDWIGIHTHFSINERHISMNGGVWFICYFGHYTPLKSNWIAHRWDKLLQIYFRFFFTPNKYKAICSHECLKFIFEAQLSWSSAFHILIINIMLPHFSSSACYTNETISVQRYFQSSSSLSSSSSFSVCLFVHHKNVYDVYRSLRKLNPVHQWIGNELFSKILIWYW